jgi:3-isopropylmalate dehydrogenase
LIAGSEHAMARAVHGTAPDIARRGIADPSALILSTALLLNWFYQRTRIEACRETARLLDLGVRHATASGAATPDLGGAPSTEAFATAVIAALEAAQGC